MKKKLLSIIIASIAIFAFNVTAYADFSGCPPIKPPISTVPSFARLIQLPVEISDCEFDCSL